LLPKVGAESMRYYEATAFHVREKYTGPLLGLIWRSIPDLGPSSGRFAQGLKRRVETGR